MTSFTSETPVASLICWKAASYAAISLEQRLTHDSTHALYAVAGVDGQSAMQAESTPPGQLDGDGDGVGAGDGDGDVE